MTARDPADGRKMPPNGNDFVSTQCNRGVRKVRDIIRIHTKHS